MSISDEIRRVLAVKFEANLTTDTGWVDVGTDHDTAAFAVESIRR